MSSEQDQVRELARRVAQRVENGGMTSLPAESPSSGNLISELTSVRTALERLEARLVQIESHVGRKGNGVQDTEHRSASTPPAMGVRSPWLSGMYVPSHPSDERFGVEEAAVSELVDFFEGEKKCEIEPGGKPCDHCSMCRSRGF